MKTPTLKEKVKMYEDFLHKLDLMQVCGDNESVKKLLVNASSFSYAHRVGNGEYSEREQQKIINAKFWRLVDV
jgi:hypothetical protein